MLTALNAMRVGLLTRFMGVLGIIVGVLFVIPLEGALPIVKVFWLVALGVLFLGRWPGGMPPAWVTGEAQPWPTQQELREAAHGRARRARRRATPRRSAPSAARAAGAPSRPRRRRRSCPRAKPHSSSKKKQAQAPLAPLEPTAATAVRCASR